MPSVDIFCNNILDLILTNLSHLYSAPVIFAPLGTSDHNTVMWSVDTGRAQQNVTFIASHNHHVRLSVGGAVLMSGSQTFKNLSVLLT